MVSLVIPDSINISVLMAALAEGVNMEFSAVLHAPDGHGSTAPLLEIDSANAVLTSLPFADLSFADDDEQDAGEIHLVFELANGQIHSFARDNNGSTPPTLASHSFGTQH